MAVRPDGHRLPPRLWRITASFAPVAKHYRVGVDICPSRHGNRKGVVEKGNHCLAQRWWRTLPDDLTLAQAQAHLDAFCARVGDVRARKRDGVPTTVGQLAEAEPLHVPPRLPYPGSLVVQRVVSAQALVAFRGNFYSVPPGLAGATMTVRHRLAGSTLEVLTAGGLVLARHHRELDGAGVIARHDEHVAALQAAVLAGFSDRAPCRRKQRRPPSAAAHAEGGRIRGERPAAGEHVVVDFARYAAAAQAATRIGEQDGR